MTAPLWRASSTLPASCEIRKKLSFRASYSHAFKPVNMDVLPLYILLVALFPPVLWAMLRKPNLTLAASVALYLAARHFGWNLRAYPDGMWYFNPFCWQLLFVFGGWFALGGSLESMPLIRSRALIAVGSAYLAFALAMICSANFRIPVNSCPSGSMTHLIQTTRPI